MVTLVMTLVLGGLLGMTPVTAGAAGINDDGLYFEILGGVGAGDYPAEEFYWTIPAWSQADGMIQGPVVYGGYGCADDRAEIPDPSILGPLGEGERSVAVFQRGPADDPNQTGGDCDFGEKVESGQLAGYDVVAVANHPAGANAAASLDEPYCAPPGQYFNSTVVGFCIGHRALHPLFGTDPDYSIPYSEDVEQCPGDLGEHIRVTSLGQPMLASGSGLGQGWVSYAVPSPGDTIEFPIRLDGEVSPGQIGAWLYSGSEDFRGGVAFSSSRSEISIYGTVSAPGTSWTSRRSCPASATATCR